MADKNWEISGVSTPLPKWKSHKEVWADKIVGIHKRDTNSEQAIKDDSFTIWTLACGGYIHVSNALVSRGFPSVGDYYVRYEDKGFEFWSPARAFENEYTRI